MQGEEHCSTAHTRKRRSVAVLARGSEAERSNDKERSERAGRDRGVGCGSGIAGEKALVGAALHLRTSPLA